MRTSCQHSQRLRRMTFFVNIFARRKRKFHQAVFAGSSSFFDQNKEVRKSGDTVLLSLDPSSVWGLLLPLSKNQFSAEKMRNSSACRGVRPRSRPMYLLFCFWREISQNEYIMALSILLSLLNNMPYSFLVFKNFFQSYNFPFCLACRTTWYCLQLTTVNLAV